MLSSLILVMLLVLGNLYFTSYTHVVSVPHNQGDRAEETEILRSTESAPEDVLVASAILEGPAGEAASRLLTGGH